MRTKEPHRRVLNAVARAILTRKYREWLAKADECAVAAESASNRKSPLAARIAGRSVTYRECAEELQEILGEKDAPR